MPSILIVAKRREHSRINGLTPSEMFL